MRLWAHSPTRGVTQCCVSDLCIVPDLDVHTRGAVNRPARNTQTKLDQNTERHDTSKPRARTSRVRQAAHQYQHT